MDSIIEVQRQSHEEIERYEQALADLLSKQPTSSREALRNQHKAYDVLERIAGKKKVLKEQYDDVQGLRAKELAALSAPAARDHELDEFYTRFESIKKRHTAVPGGMTAEPEGRIFVNMLKGLVESDGKERRKVDDGPDEVIDRESNFRRPYSFLGSLEPELNSRLLPALDSMFSGEEGMGRFLDLYISHSQYVNLKGARR